MKMPDALKSWPEWGVGLTSEPEVISRLEEGLTNSSYLLGADNSRWVLRLNASNSEQLGIDRQVEQRILAATSVIGLSPRRYYCSPESGILVSEYLPAWQPALVGQFELGQMAAQMRRLHSLAIDGVPAVDYLEYSEQYVDEIKAAGAWTPDLASLRDRQLPRLEAFQAFPLARRALCHHDPSPSHWRLQGQELCLIDWEYAALRDPACDLALLVESWQLSGDQVAVLLSGYGDCIDVERLMAAQRVCHYVNQLWFALQNAFIED